MTSLDDVLVPGKADYWNSMACFWRSALAARRTGPVNTTLTFSNSSTGSGYDVKLPSKVKTNLGESILKIDSASQCWEIKIALHSYPGSFRVKGKLEHLLCVFLLCHTHTTGSAGIAQGFFVYFQG